MIGTLFVTCYLKADHNANVYLNNPILTELEELQQRLLHPTPDLDVYTQNGVLVGFKFFSLKYFLWNSLGKILLEYISFEKLVYFGFFGTKFETNFCQKPESITYNQFILMNTDIGH